MRAHIAVLLLLGACVLLSEAQRDRPTRARSSWSNTAGVQNALRNIGIGTGGNRNVSSFNLNNFLANINGNRFGNRPRNRTAGLPTVPTPPPTTQPPSTDEPGTVAPLSRQTINEINREFEDLFRRNPNKIPKYVQMGFHICVGGCDGCLDLKDEDNFGLVDTYGELERLYNNRWTDVLSLADYAVLSAFGAAKAGVQRDTDGCNFRPCSISFDFKSGRRTCPDPKNPVPPTIGFPKGHDIAAPRRFADAFGLTDTEMVALLGCHSLGSMLRNVSGFHGPWDLSPLVLDNGYFQALANIVWTPSLAVEANAHQWTGNASSGPSLTMLHADMILARNFEVTGAQQQRRPSCPMSNSCALAATENVITEFANSNPAFLRSLKVAYTKMCDTADFDPTTSQTFEDGV